MKIFMCWRCLTFQSVDELRDGCKLKGYPMEVCRAVKMCKNCKCRTFIKL